MNQEYNRVKEWVTEQAPILDKLIRSAGVSYFNNNFKKRYFNYDTNATINDLWLLSQGKDLCYDRPSIGFTYSLWYHGKRINGLIDFFINVLLDSKNEKQIEIFDLGAGTGAIQWVVGLVYEAMKFNGISTPKIKIINVDSSAFMLDYNRHYLWEKFSSSYTNCKEFSIDYELNSWTNSDNREYTNVWLCASYLFDHSENQNLIAEAFMDLSQKYQPQKIILLSAWGKRQLVDSVGSLISQVGFHGKQGTFSREILTGPLNKVNELRSELNSRGLSFKGTCKWNIDTWYGKVLERNQISLGLGFPKKFDMYQAPVKDRKSIRLTKEQQKASQITRRPVIIIGPAGCGKSVVLTEKVKNIVELEGNEYDPKLNILLTTFNKDLVKYLGDWLESILDRSKYKRFYDHYYNNQSSHSYFQFSTSNRPNITVMHFDVLPTKVGGIRAHSIKPDFTNYEEYHRDVMRKAIESYAIEKGINKDEYRTLLNPEFLLEEYHRVIYGLQCVTPNAYMTVSREGRGNTPRLIVKGKRREIVSGCLKKYKSLLNEKNHESFIIRRRRFLNRLNKGQGRAGDFTHILVDEFQDCCKADYDIFYALLNYNNNLTIAGDLAQAINIGTTAQIPRPQNETMSAFQKIYLEGSFRLPFRVSECIKALSQKIKEKFKNTGNTEVFEIIPYKGAPPGARPIIVKGKSKSKIAEKVNEIFECYKVFDPERILEIAVFEKDNELIGELSKLSLDTSNNIAQKIKGLEKAFVLWSTKISVDTDNEIDEFIYTILTRTTNVLVIAVEDEMMSEYFDIIKSFDSDRLIFWDKASEDTYNGICAKETKIKDYEEEKDEQQELTALETEEDELI